MTKEEAIFCEKSYIGETNCVDCKYYGTETCQSRESHRMAVKALEQEPKSFQWCTDCKEYDQDKHCCHRWSKVIRDTVVEMNQEQEPIIDKIRAEIEQDAFEDVSGSKYIFVNRINQIIDKYKAESEET